MPKTKVIPYLEALFAVIVWGATFIATKIALREASPATIVWLRFGMGTHSWHCSHCQKAIRLAKKSEWLYFLMLGFLGCDISSTAASHGLQTAKATTTAWIVATTPVFIAILGWLWLKEKLNGIQIIGIVLAGLGVLLIVSKGNIKALFTGAEGTFGDLLILISSVNWAVYTILSRRELARHPAARMMFWVMTASAGCYQYMDLRFRPGKSEISPLLTTSGWWAMILLGIFTTGWRTSPGSMRFSQLPAAQTGAFLQRRTTW
jgi:drug/metabolite transporter (DMT)-like permease